MPSSDTWRESTVMESISETGIQGKFLPLAETIRSFEAIVGGEVDDLPEAAFFNVGSLDEAVAKSKTM